MAFEPGQPFNLSSLRPSGFMNAINNPGREPAVILEVLVHTEGEALPEPPMGSTVELIGSTPFQQLAGAITRVNLMRITVNGDGSPAVSVSGQQQTVFIAVEAGTMAMDPRPGMSFSVGAIGDEVSPASPTLADGEMWAVTLGANMTVHGESLEDTVTVSGEEPLTTLSLTVEHEFQDVASAQGELIEVRPDDCTIEPRTIEAFEAILSDPFAEGTPRAGMRDQAGTGVAADQETIDGVTDTVRQIVACNAPGTHLEMYSLYSENMLRFHAAAGSMTIADITGLDQLATPASVSPVSGFIAVENVVIFPDGRTGAMVNANGELAYLAFVYEDGRWLIDFWDDQLDGPEATPGK
jgi:hypothetical protein